MSIASALTRRCERLRYDRPDQRRERRWPWPPQGRPGIPPRRIHEKLQKRAVALLHRVLRRVTLDAHARQPLASEPGLTRDDGRDPTLGTVMLLGNAGFGNPLPDELGDGQRSCPGRATSDAVTLGLAVPAGCPPGEHSPPCPGPAVREHCQMPTCRAQGPARGVRGPILPPPTTPVSPFALASAHLMDIRQGRDTRAGPPPSGRGATPGLRGRGDGVMVATRAPIIPGVAVRTAAADRIADRLANRIAGRRHSPMRRTTARGTEPGASAGRRCRHDGAAL
jgi:hypothetical protein